MGYFRKGEMMKRYNFWLWAAIIFQLLTGIFHSLSLFVTPAPQNETERQLLALMTSYKRDLGGGFHRTTAELLAALSSCFTLLCFLGGLTNAYLMRKRVAADILRGVVGIQVLIFGACFVMMLIFTFLPPIILTGLIWLVLIMAYFLLRSHKFSKEV